MKYMMFSKMMNGSNSSGNGTNMMLPFMLMNSNSDMFDNMFNGMFESDTDKAKEN